jgi:hypothetical protein
VTHPLATDADSEPIRPTVVSIGAAKPHRWVVIIAAVWAVILIAGVGWSVLHGRPTDREQTTVAAAEPYADEAAARIATAAQADGQAVAVVSGFDKVGDCRVSLVRSGQRYQRVVTVLVTPGTERALLGRVAARLPGGYKATVANSPVPTLVGDAGLYVRIVASRVDPGVVRFVLDTGSCRMPGTLTPPAQPAGDRAAATPVFERLGLVPVQWQTFEVPCVGTPGQLSTVEAIGPDRQVPLNFQSTLDGLGARVASGDGLYAYRSGPAAVGVQVDNDHLVVTATEGCSQ